MTKMGRPKTDNPRNKFIGFVLTDEEQQKLKEYASRHSMTISKVLRRGVELQYMLEDKVNELG